MGRRFRASPAGIDLAGTAADDRFVKRILDERPGIGHTEEPLEVGLILGEKKRRHVRLDVEVPPGARPGADGGLVPRRPDGLEHRALGVVTPRPRVAKPDLRQDMQRGRLGTAIIGRDPAEYVVLTGLGVVDEDVKITPGGERAAQGVDQLELAVRAAAEPVFPIQESIGILHLRVLVEHPHERVARQAVEIVVIFLDVFAVVAFFVGQAEETLLQKRVLLIPECERQAKVLKTVAVTGQAVLVPAVGAAASVVVREMVPGIAAGTVIFPDSAPGPLGQIRAPVFPVSAASRTVAQAAVLGGRMFMHGRGFLRWRSRNLIGSSRFQIADSRLQTPDPGSGSRLSYFVLVHEPVYQFGDVEL